MTEFDRWWINYFGVEWYQHYEVEKKNCEAAWNAAIDAASDRCESVCHKHMNKPSISAEYMSDAADECKDEVRKLRSE